MLNVQMKINLIVETSQEYFCNWLEDFTRDAPYKNFPTEKGFISLQTARPAQYGYSGNRNMRMEGYYLTLPKDGSQTAYPISSVIEFKIIPLNQNRIEIVAECSQPVVEIYFQFLLGEIGKRWSPITSSEQQISELQEAVVNGFSELNQSQNTLINIQEKLSQVLDAIHYGQIEQGEMDRTLDAIRRALRYMQRQDITLSKEVLGEVRKANEIVDSKIELQQKVELTIPILPLFLNYKAEFGVASDVDLDNLYNEIQSRLLSLMDKSTKHNGR
jgi:hypothetical protein